jgi:hypothetical protein
MNRNFVPKSGRLMDQADKVKRFHHCSFSTEKYYVQWILRYNDFDDSRHPVETGKSEIEWFLSHQAMNRNVSASFRNQVLNFILILSRVVLKTGDEAGMKKQMACRCLSSIYTWWGLAGWRFENPLF